MQITTSKLRLIIKEELDIMQSEQNVMKLFDELRGEIKSGSPSAFGEIKRLVKEIVSDLRKLTKSDAQSYFKLLQELIDEFKEGMN